MEWGLAACGLGVRVLVGLGFRLNLTLQALPYVLPKDCNLDPRPPCKLAKADTSSHLVRGSGLRVKDSGVDIGCRALGFGLRIQVLELMNGTFSV